MWEINKPFPEEWNNRKSISLDEFKEFMESKAKQSKYKNKKVMIDGHTFDSQAEANRYCELVILKTNGYITEFELQPVFLLQDTVRKNGVTHKKIKYIADFKVTYPDGRIEIEDVKGYETPQFKLKRKIFEDKYPDLTLILL